MALYNFHRVLITASILFDAFFSYWSFQQWRETGESINLVMLVGSSVVTLGLIAYFIYFNRNLHNKRAVFDPGH
ncbi:MAG: hypothetical protein GC164_08315 [Phycisphaera sp.]|nr:hypothetical protein [Phycisphaera sp.]